MIEHDLPLATHEGPGSNFVADIYRAYCIDDWHTFDTLCDDLTIQEMRRLAQRLQRMSTQVRSLIDARMRDIDARR